MGRSHMKQLREQAAEIRSDVRKNAQRVIDEAEKRNELLNKKLSAEECSAETVIELNKAICENEKTILSATEELNKLLHR